MEAKTLLEIQPVEKPPGWRLTWTIKEFSMLNTEELYSDVINLGGNKWRLLICPKGNDEDPLSMYLDAVVDSPYLQYLQDGWWSRFAHFSLAIVSQTHNKYTVRKATVHRFTAYESDWGFIFMPLSELHNPERGYLVNDTCIVEAEVSLRKITECWTYDSRKETGYVGLENQEATGYMNSLLQTLYHIPYFRKEVYRMPSGSISLSLRRLFYKLQYSDHSFSTKELTALFGRDTQHDVLELYRAICEKLKDEMKGTVVEGVIQQLFEGHHMNHTKCTNEDNHFTSKESFYDLQLDVKGCQDVYASFDKYVEVERLEGDNKYDAEQHGSQDAKKGVLFIDFPPVLVLQLKRFEYDFARNTKVMIDDRYEIPLQLDLDREDRKYLSPYADRRVRNLYLLHGVLVHVGGVHDGPYAFIRPELAEQWFKFDDAWVTKEDIKRALEDQCGGQLRQTNPNTAFKFACMLVYIRKSDVDKIFLNVDEKDITEQPRIRLQQELEDQKKKKAKAHLYTVKVARDEDLTKQIGSEIYFDLVDHNKVQSFHIQKHIPFNLFKEEVAKAFGVPVQCQRFWFWAKRQHHTYRPDRPLTPLEETESVAKLTEVSSKAHNEELDLFLEIQLGQDLLPIRPPDRTKEDILLFFKLYDAEKEEIRYVGKLFVNGGCKPLEILKKLNEMAGFSQDEEIELYEEVYFEPTVTCEHIDKKLTFCDSQLGDGDIIFYQKRASADSTTRYKDVPSFLEYAHRRQVVHFRSLEKPKDEGFCLELLKVSTYDDVTASVAKHLGLDDPTKIKLTPHNCYSQQPNTQAIKYQGVHHLSEMLIHYDQTSNILYYEVLDIPLPELQGLKTLKVAFHHATKEDTVVHSIRLPKQSTVGDLINDLKRRVQLSYPEVELRLLEVFWHMIYKNFPLSEKIENINDQYKTLRAEEIPKEEKNMGPQEHLIHVYHFTIGASQSPMNFGKPFFLIICEGESLLQVKLRIQKKLQVPDEELPKLKFTIFSSGRHEYLLDSDVVSSHFQRTDTYEAWKQCLGIDHSDSSWRRDHN